MCPEKPRKWPITVRVYVRGLFATRTGRDKSGIPWRHAAASGTSLEIIAHCRRRFRLIDFVRTNCPSTPHSFYTSIVRQLLEPLDGMQGRAAGEIANLVPAARAGREDRRFGMISQRGHQREVRNVP